MMSDFNKIYIKYCGGNYISKRKEIANFMESSCNSNYSKEELNYFLKLEFNRLYEKDIAGIFLTYMINNSKINELNINNLNFNYFGYDLEKNKTITIFNNYGNHLAYFKSNGTINIFKNLGCNTAFGLFHGGLINVIFNYDRRIGFGAEPKLINILYDNCINSNATVMTNFKKFHQNVNLDNVSIFLDKILEESGQELILSNIFKMVQSELYGQNNTIEKNKLLKISSQILNRLTYSKGKFPILL